MASVRVLLAREMSRSPDCCIPALPLDALHIAALFAHRDLKGLREIGARAGLRVVQLRIRSAAEEILRGAVTGALAIDPIRRRLALLLGGTGAAKQAETE